jgi:hypothetical protein
MATFNSKILELKKPELKKYIKDNDLKPYLGNYGELKKCKLVEKVIRAEVSKNSGAAPPTKKKYVKKVVQV